MVPKKLTYLQPLVNSCILFTTVFSMWKKLNCLQSSLKLKVLKIHVVTSPPFFPFLPLSVLCSVSFSLAFLFFHSSVLLPVDS